jgi:hypothetical protein
VLWAIWAVWSLGLAAKQMTVVRRAQSTGQRQSVQPKSISSLGASSAAMIGFATGFGAATTGRGGKRSSPALLARPTRPAIELREIWS